MWKSSILTIQAVVPRRTLNNRLISSFRKTLDILSLASLFCWFSNKPVISQIIMTLLIHTSIYSGQEYIEKGLFRLALAKFNYTDANCALFAFFKGNHYLVQAASNWTHPPCCILVAFSQKASSKMCSSPEQMLLLVKSLLLMYYTAKSNWVVWAVYSPYLNSDICFVLNWNLAWARWESVIYHRLLLRPQRERNNWDSLMPISCM